MKNLVISSWNVNKAEQCTIGQLAKTICEEDCDILFLHEFPTNKISELIDNINGASKNKYILLITQNEFKATYYITLALIKESLSSMVSVVDVSSSNLTKDIPLKLRWLELRILAKDNYISVLGIHCPMYTTNLSRNKKVDIFWKNFIDYAKSKELLIIGDLNVNINKRNRWTNDKKELFKGDYIDLDVEENKNTFIAETRIDYALVHKSLYDDKCIKMIEPKYIDQNKNNLFELSDHKMISINIDI